MDSNNEYDIDLMLLGFSILLAALGGFVGYLQKAKALDWAVFDLYLLISVLGAAFVGILVFLGVQAIQGDALLTLLAVGIAGQFNGDGVNIVKNIFYAIMSARFNVDLREKNDEE